MMERKLIQIGGAEAAVFGAEADKVWLFVHGKSGNREEGAFFAEIVCPKGWQVAAIDLPGHGHRKNETGFDPWHVVPELQQVMAGMKQRWHHVCLRANSIGALFSMIALGSMPPEQALLVSPIVDMEKLIKNMMAWSGVDEAQLEREREIPTAFGETLSWRYLQYVRETSIHWSVPTEILYAGHDDLTDRATIRDFSDRFGCGLTVMEDGEHWFHTPEQLAMMTAWEDSHTT